MTTFKELGLEPKLLAAIEAAGYDQPTPIQAQAIPHVLNGHDVMGLAQTGTGKTAAFGLPLVNHLLGQFGKPEPKTVKALVLAPTRELVNQIAENLKTYVQGTPLKVHTVVGGASINKQIQFLSRGTDILVATPGRLIDLTDRKAVRLDTAHFLVLDEADQMLDLGFIHALRKIAPMLAKERQTMLFSATMPKQMEELSQAYLDRPKKVQVNPPGMAAEKIDQSLHFVGSKGKYDLLKEMLDGHPEELALVFCRTKHGAEKLKKHLEDRGYPAESIHGNKSQGQRDRAIRSFRDGHARILVATDVAARGIDIPGVRFVYNYELPEVPENYVHRIGRTARAGKAGKAVSLVGGAELGRLKDIEKLMKRSIEVAGGERPEEEDAPSKGRGRGGHRRGGKPGFAKSAGKSAGANAQGRPQRKRRQKRRAA
ncbi:DEAD/DEAH box helicase [Pseudoruegeria sp. SHC-113]|uniref:DEAD/DEAH box helicase n=1 Tax=Pseudoruegeria sp. SHC-113 TaxID=2855439 RepID=UPI0021BAA10D|nr:DEAD/DEAH box helicase [Pseudoruegeria sp. SHC-113]MCT8158761.1 DEAD/DEAH box helicase [Pseudoruegeria sp. SHC-113]